LTIEAALGQLRQGPVGVVFLFKRLFEQACAFLLAAFFMPSCFAQAIIVP
jgi:hypothetical protein